MGPRAEPRSLSHTLGALRAGAGDPTTRLDQRSFVHATYTPDGPGTLRLTWRRDPSRPSECGLTAEGWGPGAAWLLGRVEAMCGARDLGVDVARRFPDADPIVVRCLAATRTTWLVASGNLYHALVPVVIAQRITAGEARRQWARLCIALGEPAPGPDDVIAGLRLPPAPAALARRPAWWFHPLGIEAKRAGTVSEVARHADRLWTWGDDRASAATGLGHLRGVGPWSIGSVMMHTHGDADAVPVGDFHFPNIVAWNLAGEPRADDERMLELLAPYAGERGRVLRAIVRAGQPAPAFGPRRRTLPIARL